MLTPDDGSSHGQTRAEWFPSRAEIQCFCRDLRTERNLDRITQLPVYTGARYDVVLHQGNTRPTDRTAYFSGFDSAIDQLVFLDPDNGFEPLRSYDDSHVCYRDIDRILEQLNSRSVVSVFQTFRRVSFPTDFARIRSRLGPHHATALFWHSLMFVAVTRSRDVIDRVRQANRAYAHGKPVTVLGDA